MCTGHNTIIDQNYKGAYYMLHTYCDTISGEASAHFCVSTVQQTSSVSCAVVVTPNVLYSLGSITLHMYTSCKRNCTLRNN